jgi:hypothetical protein
MTTVKPSAASRSAIAAPIPREAPVMIASFQFAFDICHLRIVEPRSLRLMRMDLRFAPRKIIGHKSASLFWSEKQ